MCSIGVNYDTAVIVVFRARYRVGLERLIVLSSSLLYRCFVFFFFFFSSRRRHTRFDCDWSSDVCSSDLELADGGTLLLDEVGDLGPEAQAKLLRVLETGVIERLGGEKPVTVDVRVIAATNKDLSRATHQGQFREDLLFRLNVLPVHILPLRERPEDIPPLVQHFAARQAARLGRPVRCDAGAVQLLAAYAWPGNVRELANLVERLAILATGATITADDVARVVRRDGAPPPPPQGWADVELSQALDQFERTLLPRALSPAHGHAADAARKPPPRPAHPYPPLRPVGLRA